jgi:hypothetical protein
MGNIYLWQKHQLSQGQKKYPNSPLDRKTDVFAVGEVTPS